ncbi:MAG: hypothetical protein ACKV2T_01695 [Kofleriaceae bacterium]
MKKCSSCTKDLPDAALHCVFCGAKQAPAAATPPAAMAKTVMGYNANDEINRARDQAAQNAARNAPGALGHASTMASPGGLGHAATLATPGGLGHASTMASPGPSPGARPGQSPYGAPAGGSFGGAPGAGAQARTMFVDQGPPPGAMPQQGRPPSPSQPAPMLGPAVPGGMPLGGPSPMADVKTFAPDPGRIAPAVGAPGGPQLPHGHGGPAMGGPGQGYGGPSMGGPGQGYGGPSMGGPGQGYGGPSMGGPGQGYGGPSMGGPGQGYGGLGHGPGPGYQGPAANPDAKTILPAYNPQPVAPSAPAWVPSYQTTRGGRPIDPFKDTLRTQLFIWGGILVACFAVPISLSPMIGMWDAVIHGEGTAKLGPLLLVAVGLLSIVIAAIPMTTGPRGLIASMLALAGILVPMLVIAPALPEWQALLSIAGTMILVPALLARNEYTESSLPRILITVGALAALAPFLIPQNGSIPLVDLFRLLIDAPGKLKILMALFVGYVLVLVLTLLAWMPAPATAGAKVLAWVLLLFPLIVHAVGIVLSGGSGIDFERNLNPLVLGWAYGASAAGAGAAAAIGALGLGSAYLAISSYGLASVIGKKLE